MNIVAEGINDAWVQVISALKEEGRTYSPRGMKIKEIQNMSVEIKDPKKRILTLPVRNISLPFAFGELIWYLSARNDLAMMDYYSSTMKRFSDDGKTLNSAYGYRIFGYHEMLPFNQWKFVVNKLNEDKETRQAIIHLHTPNNKKTKDEVCTLSLQFFIRDGKLDMVVNMRSNDIIWGFTYDVFSFTSIQELMANELGVGVGSYFHNAASMHIYEKDFSYFEHMEIKKELMYMTKYDEQFDYKGATIHDIDFYRLVAVESSIRESEKFIIDSSPMMINEIENETLRMIANTLNVYKIYKTFGKESAIDLLKYDDLYHGVMRNYFHRKSLKESHLTIIEGCDGAGKSTFIYNIAESQSDDVIAFGHPKDFNKLIYFQTALLRGNVILDRFFLSELIYSNHYERECIINESDVSVLEGLLNYRNSTLALLDTDPSVCYNRLDKKDRKTFSKINIGQICEGYTLRFRVSNIRNKYRLVLKREVE